MQNTTQQADYFNIFNNSWLDVLLLLRTSKDKTTETTLFNKSASDLMQFTYLILWRLSQKLISKSEFQIECLTSTRIMMEGIDEYENDI